MHLEGLRAFVANSTHFKHFSCSCNQLSGASAPNQIDMHAACQPQRFTPAAPGASIICGIWPDAAVLVGWVTGAGAAGSGSRAQPGSDRGGGGEAGETTAAAAAGVVAREGMTDAELALMLQREEQQAHLLELAGYGDGDYS